MRSYVRAAQEMKTGPERRRGAWLAAFSGLLTI